MYDPLSSPSPLGQEAARETTTADQGEDKEEENDANDDTNELDNTENSLIIKQVSDSHMSS